LAQSASMVVSPPTLSLPCPPGEIEGFLSRPQPLALEALAKTEGDILVLGAGGKMGLHMCRLLRAALDQLGRKDRRVWAASRFRTLASQQMYADAGIPTCVGDFRDTAFLESLPECPTVVYMVGAKFGTADDPALLQEINVKVAQRVAARFPAARFLVFSTGCVYRYTTPESGGSTEADLTNPVGAYAQSCLGREAAFVDAWRNAVLIRLNYAVEFRYGVPVDIATKVLAGEPVDVTMGYVNLIWQNDALNQIVACLDHTAVPPCPLNITGADIIAVRELAHEFGQLFNREPRIVGEEAETAWLSNAAISHHHFGRPAIDVPTMTRWIAAWLQQGLTTYNKPTGFEKRDGKF